jgi:transcriptional regulator with XRE-family HTH domain
MNDKPEAYVMRNYQDFLTTLDRIRYRRGMSLRQLGELVGTSSGHTGRWMRGEVTALAPIAWALADALGYDIALIPRQPKEDA